MSLVEKLSAERKQLKEEQLTGVIENILAITEACVKADKTSLHIRFRMEFDDVGNNLKVIVNYREVDNINISSLLGTVDEKHACLLEKLHAQGFTDTTHIQPESWGSECSKKQVHSIGFDI